MQKFQKQKKSDTLSFETKNVEEISAHFSTDLKNGLSSEEAKIRLEKYGPNKLEEKKKKTWFQIFIEQMKNPYSNIGKNFKEYLKFAKQRKKLEEEYIDATQKEQILKNDQSYVKKKALLKQRCLEAVIYLISARKFHAEIIQQQKTNLVTFSMEN